MKVSQILETNAEFKFKGDILAKIARLGGQKKSYKKNTLKKNIFSLVDTPYPLPRPLSGLSNKKISFCGFLYINKKIKVVQFTHESIN